LADAPDWLLGRIRWRGWQLPLLAFSRFAGIAEERGGLGSKVVVLKALGDEARQPFFALLTQGFPRLVTVTEAALASVGDDAAVPEGVLARVRLNEDEALLPDLAALEERIAEALAVAA
jgi:chemosensory pili system protein ChpC